MKNFSLYFMIVFMKASFASLQWKFHFLIMYPNFGLILLMMIDSTTDQKDRPSCRRSNA
jgi:hypothetical protein